MLRKTLLRDTKLESSKELDLRAIASFEVSSEAAEHPLENILSDDDTRWEATDEGRQIIRIRFDEPAQLSRIVLVFEERTQARTQEFTINWKPASEAGWREVRRQQFNFSPPTTTTEREDFELALSSVEAIEIVIVPSIGGGGIASLTRLVVE